MRMRIIGSFAAFLISCSAAVAQPLADRVPADALVYVGWSGSESMGPGYEGSHLKAVLDESKVSELINDSIPKLLKKAGMADRQAGEVAGMIAAIGGPVWRHPTALYVGGVDMTNPQMMHAKVALVCDAGAEGKALADQLNKLIANAPQTGMVKVEEQGGVVVLSAGTTGWGAAQKPAAPLSAGKAFQGALAQVQKAPVAAVYVDVEGIVKQVDALAGQGPAAPNWLKAKDALGLGGIKRAIWTSGFEGKDWSSQAFVEAPAPRTGMLAGLFNGDPLTTGILRLIPQSATVAAAGRFDLGGLLSAVRSAAASFDPNGAAQLDEGIKQVNGMLGFDVQADLLNAFGNEWAVYVDPMSAGNGLLGITVANQAKDPKKLEASLTKLENLANGMMKDAMRDAPVAVQINRAQVGGTTLHHLAVPFVSPSWAVKDGNIYLGLYPQVVEAAIEQGGGKGTSILDNPAFNAVRKRLGEQPPSGITFADLPKTAPEGYQEVMMISRLYLGMADLVGADTPAMLLPPLRKIMPHLSPAGSVSWSDASGWHHKSISPFPGSELFTPGGGGQMIIGQQALMASIMLPSLNRAREQANRVKCAANMRTIGQAMMLYANENKGKYAPDLGTLYLTQDVSHVIFMCPSTNTELPPNLAMPAGDNAAAQEKWRKDVAAWINANADYVYLGAGKNTTAPADFILCYEKPDNHRQAGMNMLFGDGHVEFVLMSEAQRVIQAQQQKPRAPRGGGL